MSIDLTTCYGGLKLRSPMVVGACPITSQDSMRLAIETSGAGAIVLPSLFEEQVLLWNDTHGHLLTRREQEVIERSRRMGGDTKFEDSDSYLAMVSRASNQMSIPVIASLNGENANIWLNFASELQGAGASGIELNLHHPPPGEYDGPREIEDDIVEAVGKISDAISIPLFLKLGREYTSISHLAVRLLARVQGLVLFGRSPEIDISLDTLTLTTDWLLTPSGNITRLLESLMQVHTFCPSMPIAACGGVSSASDVIKVLLSGADIAMVSSAVYREGPDIIRTMLDGLIVFMERHSLRSIQELQCSRPRKFSSEEERLDYIQALSSRVGPQPHQPIQRTMQGDRWGHPAALL